MAADAAKKSSGLSRLRLDRGPDPARAFARRAEPLAWLNLSAYGALPRAHQARCAPPRAALAAYEPAFALPKRVTASMRLRAPKAE
jgi:hypothetical protein